MDEPRGETVRAFSELREALVELSLLLVGWAVVPVLNWLANEREGSDG